MKKLNEPLKESVEYPMKECTSQRIAGEMMIVPCEIMARICEERSHYNTLIDEREAKIKVLKELLKEELKCH